MTHADTPIPLDTLLALTQDPGSRGNFSPLSANPYLLLNTQGVEPAPRQESDRVVQWLHALACPVIGISAERNWLATACDAVVADAAEAQPMIDGITAAPIAATVLVQLLRASESLPIDAALIAESLAYATLQAGPEFKRWLATHRAAAPFQPQDDGPALILERNENSLDITLNRASNHNAMNVEMRDALCEALQLMLSDSSLERVNIKARGKCFSTGGDLTEFGSAPDPARAHIIRSLALPGRLLAECAARVEVRVHGACIGSGIEFPAFAGHITAATKTLFQLPELKYGLIPGAGGTVSIARRIGRQRTAWLALSGKKIGATKALEWGLVDQLTDNH